MPQWVCLNGTLVPAEEARISVFDSGFMQGIGLFETMRTYNRQVFRLQRHLDRLVQSAQVLGWVTVPDADVLADYVEQVVQATSGDESRVRLTVTTGSLHAAADQVPALTVVATATPAEKYPEDYYRKGVTVVLSGCDQGAGDPTVGHKTTSYFPRLATLRAAHALGAFEALWRTVDGHLAEGAISNLFIVKEETLLTPPLDAPVLPGITRATVCELAVAADIPVREAPVTLEDLRGAEEVFVTNSMIELMPVVRLGRERIGAEKPGEITRELLIAYGELIDRECGGSGPEKTHVV
jgi:branched-chain amino acid aminotransferase